MGNVMQLALIDLIPGDFHPHQENQNENLDGLINSIKNLGIIEPLIVRKKDDKYEIINGNRRYNAAKQLNLEKIPALVINATDEDVLNIVITNNVQRKELTGKEEALLYEKAIKYPNVNIEQLSLKLGIPEDRITSKLKIIKKAENKSNQIITNNNLNQQNQQSTNIPNNMINNDIINLNELNNKEIRRERSNMNENQFMTPNNQPAAQGFGQNPEPTFGGRFFPSVENPNQTGSNPNQGMQQEISTSQLVDLTGTAPAMSTPEPAQPLIMEQPMPAPEVNNNVSVVPTSQEPNPAPVNNIEMPSMIVPENNQMNIEPTPTLEELEQTLNINPTQAPSVSEVPNINIPNEPINNQPPIDLNNVPNLNAQTVTQPKEVTPIINMLKSIATNMELLGYKINVTENEGPTNYSINIEVEK